MSDEGSLKTDFLDKQAKYISRPGMALPVKILLAAAVLGVSWGGYQLVMFFTNIDKINAMKNVEVNLQKPDMRDGMAMVDVTVENLNPIAVSNTAFRYSIMASSGATVATGVVTIPDPVPAGDSRMFRHVKLGELHDSAARMHAELVDLKPGPKAKLTADQDARFAELAVLKGEEKQRGFEQFVKDVPDFLPGYIELGRAYMSTNDYDKAIDILRQAVKVDAKYGDAHYLLAIALQHNGEKKAAGKELEKALDLMPDDTDVQRTMQYFNPLPE